MNATILVVRHADVHNPRSIIYGRLPRYRLSTLGQQQAAWVASLLSREPITAIYTSPQLRARQTAAHIAYHHEGVPVNVSGLLAEVRTAWQGTPSAVAGSDPYFYASPKAPSDETIAQIGLRIRCFAERALRHHPGETVVAVSHGDPIVIWRLLAVGRDLTIANMREAPYPANASVMRLEYSSADGVPKVEYVDSCIA